MSVRVTAVPDAHIVIVVRSSDSIFSVLRARTGSAAGGSYGPVIPRRDGTRFSVTATVSRGQQTRLAVMNVRLVGAEARLIAPPA